MKSLLMKVGIITRGNVVRAALQMKHAQENWTSFSQILHAVRLAHRILKCNHTVLAHDYMNIIMIILCCSWWFEQAVEVGN